MQCDISFSVECEWLPHVNSLYLNLNQCHFQTTKFKVISLLVLSPRSLLLSNIVSRSDMEGNVPSPKSFPQGTTTGPTEYSGPTPNIGKPGNVNGPATIPHLERGVHGYYGAGGTNSLPLQGQVPA